MKLHSELGMLCISCQELVFVWFAFRAQVRESLIEVTRWPISPFSTIVASHFRDRSGEIFVSRVSGIHGFFLQELGVAEFYF
jgi:hypothetical protein